MVCTMLCLMLMRMIMFVLQTMFKGMENFMSCPGIQLMTDVHLVQHQHGNSQVFEQELFQQVFL